jgi:hypothetical protein
MQKLSRSAKLSPTPRFYATEAWIGASLLPASLTHNPRTTKPVKTLDGFVAFFERVNSSDVDGRYWSCGLVFHHCQPTQAAYPACTPHTTRYAYSRCRCGMVGPNIQLSFIA